MRVSVCHCLECQRRTGSAFAVQARWPEGQVALTGRFSIWSRLGDSGMSAAYRFCPLCGSTVAYENEGMPGLIAIPVGAFADPMFPAPGFSVYEERMHTWVQIVGDEVEHQN